MQVFLHIFVYESKRLSKQVFKKTWLDYLFFSLRMRSLSSTSPPSSKKHLTVWLQSEIAKLCVASVGDEENEHVSKLE